jgi:hypothetical protein
MKEGDIIMSSKERTRMKVMSRVIGGDGDQLPASEANDEAIPRGGGPRIGASKPREAFSSRNRRMEAVKDIGAIPREV